MRSLALAFAFTSFVGCSSTSHRIPAQDAEPIIQNDAPDAISNVVHVRKDLSLFEIPKNTDLCVEVGDGYSENFEIKMQSGKTHMVTIYQRAARCSFRPQDQLHRPCHSIIYRDDGFSCERGAKSETLSPDEYLHTPPSLTISDHDTKKTKVQKLLGRFAMNHCGLVDFETYTNLEPLPLVIAKCFTDTDRFSAAVEKNRFLARDQTIGARNTGLAMTCTRAIGFECAKDFIKAAAIPLHHLDELIEESGDYRFTGFGKDAKQVWVMPELKATISVEGHSTVYFEKNNQHIKCHADPPFRGCIGL